MKRLTPSDKRRIEELISLNISTYPLCSIESKVQFMQEVMKSLLQRTLELEQQLESKQ